MLRSELLLFFTFSHIFIFGQSVSAKKIISKNKPNKVFKWDVEVNDKGSLMYLDIPYNTSNGLEFASFTIAKVLNKNRPEFISVALPKEINKSRGVDFIFTDVPLRKKSDTLLIHENFIEEYKDNLIVRMNAAYSANGKIDILDFFLHKKYLIVEFYGQNLKVKILILPLSTFRNQYSQLL